MFKKLLLTAVLAPVLLTAARAAAQVSGIDMSDVDAISVDPISGATAIADAENSLVTTFPSLVAMGDRENGKELKLGKEPVAVLYQRFEKAAYLLVGCRGDRTVYVLDATSGKQVKTIGPMKVELMTLDGPPGASEPYVYYTFGGAGGRGESGMGRISLKTLSDEGTIVVPESASWVLYPGVDGLLYATRRGVSPSGVFAFKIAAKPASGPVRGEQILYEHDSIPGYAPEPNGRAVAVGKQVLTADMREGIAKLPVSASRFLVTRPVLLCRDNDGSVVAVSSNSFEEVGRTSVKGVSFQGKARRAGGRDNYERRRQPRSMLVDEKNGTVFTFVDHEWRGVLFPLEALSLPDEPFLIVTRAEPNKPLAVGTPAKVELRPGDAKAKLVLKSGPKGMKLDRQTLSWTPTADDTGTAEAVVTVSVGGASQDQTLRLSVEFPSVTLPFAATQVSTSPDGAFAVVSDQGGPGAMFRDNRNDQPGSRIAVVDLRTLAIVAQRTLAAKTGPVTADEKFVYVGLSDSDALLVLNRADLSDAKRVFTPGRVQAMSAAGGKLYVSCHSQRGTAETLVLAPPEFKPAAAPSAALTPAMDFGRAPGGDLPRRAGKYWVHRGIVFDPAFAKPVMLVQPQSFVVVGNAGGMPQNPYGQASPFEPYYTSAMGGGPHGGSVTLVRLDGRQIKQIDGIGGAILSDVPAAVGIKMDQLRGPAMGDHGSPDTIGMRLMLNTHDLLTGSVDRSLPLWDEPLNRHGGGNNTTTVSTTPAGTLLVARGVKLAVVPTAALGSKSLAEPLWVPPAQSAFRVEPSGTAKITITPSGGTAPYSFDLPVEQEGIDLDAKTGTVTIDPKPFAALAPQAVAGAMGRVIMRADMVQQQTPEQRLTAYVASAGAEYARLTGAAVKGVPVAIPVTVKVTDAEQQSQTVRQVVLLDVPLADVREQLRKAGPATAPTAVVHAPGFATTQPAFGGTGGGDEVNALRRRVLELERENARLEGKIEALQEALAERGGVGGGRAPRATTRPSRRR